MAANDYDLLADGALCPIGYLASPVGPGDTAITIANFQPVAGVSEDLAVGMAVMIDNEILRLGSTTLPTLTVRRGCADTIPASHDTASVAWFFDNDTGTDGREYTAASTIGVKLLPFTGSGGSVPLEHAPPHALTFNWRFFRPYPPAQFKCRGESWHSQMFELTSTNGGATFTWVGRNRLVQADQLIGHNEAAITPEPGTTYTVRIYRADGTLVRTVSGSTGTTWTYSYAQALNDLPAREGYVTVHAVRDAFESLQGYRTDLIVRGGGLGETLGLNLGGPVNPLLWWSSTSTITQAIAAPVIRGGDILGLWFKSLSGFYTQNVVGLTIATDTGTYLSTGLANSETRAILWVGSVAYVASFSTTTPTVPAYLTHSYIHRLDSVGGTKVTWEAPTPGDELITSLGWDGVNLWSYGSKDGALRKHDPSTLDVLATYDAPDLGGVDNGGKMVWHGGLAIVISSPTQIQAYDPATDSIAWTHDFPGTLGFLPSLRICGSLLFLTMSDLGVSWRGVEVIDPTTGVLVTSYSDGVQDVGVHAIGETADFGYKREGVVRWLSGTTGAIVRERPLNATVGTFIAALDNAVVTVQAPNAIDGKSRIYYL